MHSSTRVEPDDRAAFRRARALRCDGRSRPQDDLPGTLCDGETRCPQGPGNRRSLPEVESGASAQTRDRQHKASRSDLAHKMIFPALYAMVKRGALKVPVIGVAFPKWSLARLRKRVTDSIKRSGGIDNQRAFRHLLSLLRYVSGDYHDPGTFTAIKKELGGARRRAPLLRPRALRV